MQRLWYKIIFYLNKGFYFNIMSSINLKPKGIIQLIIKALPMLTLLCFMACNPNPKEANNTNAKVPFEASWESLSSHTEAPEWLQDAKLGIYFHWGVYSVPAYGSEWYPRNMYLPRSKVFKHHKEVHGDQKEFGYHHFIPDFTAEKFDAAEWITLFQKAGARFVGPVAQHHDGFAMWDSKLNPWNAKAKGPKIDITGELAREIRKQGLKLITTFHHARNLQRNGQNPDYWDGYNSHYPYHPDYHTSSTDPELAKLYGNIPEEEFYDYWAGQINEVITQYHPDMIWFDSWLNVIPENRVRQMCADYFNAAQEQGQEVAIGYKQSDLPKEVGIQDIEQGGRRDITERPWMTDITLSYKSWCYVEGQTYKTAAMVIRNFVDVVSKNGVVLLNVSPKADGSIPDEQREVLLRMGKWFDVHGEAIYNTRPWDLFGFGNAKAGDGSHGGQSSTVQYSAEDIRFTQSKDEKSLYMILLGKPKPGDLVSLRLLARHRYTPHSPIKKITLMGSDVEVEFRHHNKGFELTIPEAPMNEIATVFKFELE